MGKLNTCEKELPQASMVTRGLPQEPATQQISQTRRAGNSCAGMSAILILLPPIHVGSRYGHLSTRGDLHNAERASLARLRHIQVQAALVRFILKDILLVLALLF